MSIVSVLSSLAIASGCAARATAPTLSTHYACGDATLKRLGDTVSVGAEEHKLGWHDGDGDHFVTWPATPTDVTTVEYVLPADRRLDATMRVYDASNGSSRADWRLVERQVCTAEGGYNDALARWMHGASLDDLTAQLALSDRDEARALVHDALISLQKRYYRDR